MSDMRDDGLTRRLRAADPVPSGRSELPSGRSIRELVEETMAQTSEDLRPSRWRVVMVAAIVAAIAAAGGGYLAARGGGQAHHVLSLTLSKAGPARPGAPGQSCIMYNVNLLGQQQLAFSGTVKSIDANKITLSVDHWYKGGNADEVDLAAPDYPNAANEFGVTFESGHRYLVSATDRTVTGCGYTGEYSAQLASDYAKAFAQ